MVDCMSDDGMMTGAGRSRGPSARAAAGTDEDRFDLASVFPQRGDPRRPPEWLGRGLLYTAIGVLASILAWRAWGSVAYIVLDVVLAVFIALAVEPIVVWLVRKGWRRGVAAATCLVVLTVVLVGLLALFGGMLAQQAIGLVRGLPRMYADLSGWLAGFGVPVPRVDAVGGKLLETVKEGDWTTGLAGRAFGITGGLLSGLLNVMTVIMVEYYVSAAGPRMRRSVCQWLGPQQQRRFLLIWTIVQDQVSSFLFSRIILAAVNACCTTVFLDVMGISYWLPLGLFCGIVSQFIPTIGTYLGGALPVLFALTGDGGLRSALIVLAFIVIYQQFENLILSPAVSQRTMSLNPAVAFLAVLAFGSLFGALGAFLALPIAASMQSIAQIALRRYEPIDSPLMNDPAPDRVSPAVERVGDIAERIRSAMPDNGDRPEEPAAPADVDADGTTTGAAGEAVGDEATPADSGGTGASPADRDAAGDTDAAGAPAGHKGGAA